MKAVKRLISETAIYGLTSIVGRVLFFLLTPLYTNINVLPQEEYGKMTHIFAISGFLLVVFGYGLETAFFRFALKEKDNVEKSYSTALSSVLGSTLVFGSLLMLLYKPLAQLLNAGNYSQLVLFMLVIVMLDSLSSIPFAYLRATNKPLKFAGIKMLNILINLGLNLFFYVACPKIMAQESGALYEFVSSWYKPSFGVGYALVANIIASAFSLFVLGKDYLLKWGFDFSLWKKMLNYGLPILVVSLAGMINEVADRQLLKWFLPGSADDVSVQVGIYGACYKLSIFLSLFTQAFRYAGEPFFFAQAKEKDAKQTYALVLKYFTIVSLFGFLFITLFIDVFKRFITSEAYWVGLSIVPILLMAYVFYGMYYNMSVWYKLTDKTKLGGLVAIIGALVTILVNVIFIPTYGYMASAWATFLCFFVMVIVSKLLGERHYPVPYDWRNIIFYIVLSVALFALFHFLQNQFAEQFFIKMLLASIGVAIYLAVVGFKEKNAIRLLMAR